MAFDEAKEKYEEMFRDDMTKRHGQGGEMVATADGDAAMEGGEYMGLNKGHEQALLWAIIIIYLIS